MVTLKWEVGLWLCFPLVSEIQGELLGCSVWELVQNAYGPGDGSGPGRGQGSSRAASAFLYLQVFPQ